MKNQFKIGDKVMGNWGSYNYSNWRAGTIIGETKTLWKCEKFSFSKVDNRVRGTGEYFPVYIREFDQETIDASNEKISRKNNWITFKNKLEQAYIDNNKDVVDKFIEWATENL